MLLARLDPDTIVRKGTKKGTKRGPHNGGPIYIYREKGTKRGTKKQTKRRSKSAFDANREKGDQKAKPFVEQEVTLVKPYCSPTF